MDEEAVEALIEELADEVQSQACDTKLSPETSIEILEGVIGNLQGWVTTIKADIGRLN